MQVHVLLCITQVLGILGCHVHPGGCPGQVIIDRARVEESHVHMRWQRHIPDLQRLPHKCKRQQVTKALSAGGANGMSLE